MTMLTGQQVADRLGTTRMTISRWQRDGYLPKPGEVKGRTHLWDELVIEAFERQVAFVDSLANVMDEVVKCRDADGDFKATAEKAATILHDLQIPLDERVRIGAKLREESWALAFGKPTIDEQLHMIRLRKTLGDFERGHKEIGRGDAQAARKIVEGLLRDAKVPD